MIKQIMKRARTAGRRKTDLWPVLTKILGNVLIITSAAVGMIYSYGFGQESNDPLIANQAKLAKLQLEKQAQEVELRVLQLAEELRRLEKKITCGGSDG